jgi:hypothetical protein
MKVEGFHHAKLLLAARDLGISVSHMRGIMTSIWHVTASHHPQGDIGSYSNEELEVAIDTGLDIERVVEVLVARRLLDAHPEVRLVVHDWHDHCETWVRKRVERNKVKKNWRFYSQDGSTPEPGDGGTARPAQTPPAPTPPAEQLPVEPAAVQDLEPPPLEPRQQAAAYIKNVVQPDIYRFLGSEVCGTPYQDLLDLLETVIKHGDGHCLTVEFCRQVTDATQQGFDAKGEKRGRTANWWINTFRDLLKEATKPAPAPKAEVAPPPPRVSVPPPRAGAPQAVAAEDRSLYVQYQAHLEAGPESDLWMQETVLTRSILHRLWDAEQAKVTA